MIGIPKYLAEEKHATFEAVMMDYAAGTLSNAQTLVMDTYLSVNERAREASLAYAAMGGALLEDECLQESVAEGCYDDILAMIDAGFDPEEEPQAKAIACAVQTQAITSYTGLDIDNIPWRTLTPGIEYYDVPVPCQKKEKAQLLKMTPGKSVLEHSHDGLELTLVLDGAFQDDTGIYRRGDLSLEEGHDHAHKPVADMTQGCICLAVTTAPVHFTGWLGRIINPIVKNI